ncbi:MAG: hypothetical protein MUE81_12060 [Thermoflexibacter sp.]|jgi:hypothetical protein|nr:hypothetical protein [Thermoflexibacter sp.]
MQISKLLIVLLLLTSAVLLSCDKNELTPSIGMIKFDLDGHNWGTEIVHWTDPKGDPNFLVFRGINNKDSFVLSVVGRSNTIFGRDFHENQEIIKEFNFTIESYSVFLYVTFVSFINSIYLDDIKINGDYLEGKFRGEMIELIDGSKIGNKTVKITNGYFKIRIDSIAKR